MKTRDGVPLKAPVEVLKLIPVGVEPYPDSMLGEMAKLAIAPPVELIVNPVAEVFARRDSEDAERVKAGA